MTGSPDLLPNFIVVGAAKAGTTSLYSWLNQHPDVFMPDAKEPTFFVRCGLRTPTFQGYRELFEGAAGHTAIGEASTAYLTDPESPGLIADALDAPRIIVMIRDPVKRAYSQYRWMCMKGYERLVTFEAALQAEDNRSRNIWFQAKSPENAWDFMYFRSGLYHDQIKRYLDTFGADRVKVFVFDDMVQRPHEFLREVCGFLGVSTDFEPSDMTPRQVSIFPRFIRLQFAFGRLEAFALTHNWRRKRVMRWTGRLKAWNNRIGRPGRMRSETESSLREKYCDEIMRVADLIGRDLSAWLPHGGEHDD